MGLFNTERTFAFNPPTLGRKNTIFMMECALLAKLGGYGSGVGLEGFGRRERIPSKYIVCSSQGTKHDGEIVQA